MKQPPHGRACVFPLSAVLVGMLEGTQPHQNPSTLALGCEPEALDLLQGVEDTSFQPLGNGRKRGRGERKWEGGGLLGACLVGSSRILPGCAGAEYGSVASVTVVPGVNPACSVSCPRLANVYRERQQRVMWLVFGSLLH